MAIANHSTILRPHRARQTLACLAVAAAVLLSGCDRPSPAADTGVSAVPPSPVAATGVDVVPLSLYIVSEQKIEGGQFVDTPDLPKVGYIAGTPDLVITRLEDVMLRASRDRNVKVDANGNQMLLGAAQPHPIITIKMLAEDTRKFSTLTEHAVGERLLIMLGDTPLTAPVVEEPISTPAVVINLGLDSDAKKIEAELKKLVR